MGPTKSFLFCFFVLILHTAAIPAPSHPLPCSLSLSLCLFSFWHSQVDTMDSTPNPPFFESKNREKTSSVPVRVDLLPSRRRKNRRNFFPPSWSAGKQRLFGKCIQPLSQWIWTQITPNSHSSLCFPTHSPYSSNIIQIWILKMGQLCLEGSHENMYGNKLTYK